MHNSSKGEASKEEGELSADDTTPSGLVVNCLFPRDLFSKLLPKVVKSLKFPSESVEDASQLTANHPYKLLFT